MGPPGREMPACRELLHLSYYISYCLSLRVPRKGAPSMFPNRVSTDRDTPSPEPLAKRGDSNLFIHSFMYVCWSLQKWALLHTYRKNIRSLSTEAHTDGRPTYDGVQPGSPRGQNRWNPLTYENTTQNLNWTQRWGLFPQVHQLITKLANYLHLVPRL
jgi:hypothetical protein